MADVGEERPTDRLVRLEPGGHRVEPGDELTDVADPVAWLGDADGVVALLDPAGRLDDLIEDDAGAAQPPRDREEGPDHEDRRDDPGDGPELRDDGRRDRHE